MKHSPIQFGSFKFSFHKNMSNGASRWRCTKYRCGAYLKCNKNGQIVEKHLNHNHIQTVPIDQDLALPAYNANTTSVNDDESCAVAFTNELLAQSQNPNAIEDDDDGDDCTSDSDNCTEYKHGDDDDDKNSCDNDEDINNEHPIICDEVKQKYSKEELSKIKPRGKYKFWNDPNKLVEYVWKNCIPN